MRYILTLTLVVLSVTASWARTLTLDEAVAIALDKNRDIARALEYGKYVQGKYVEERAAALPQLGLNGSYAALRDEGSPEFAGGGITQHDSALRVTVDQTLFTWGKVMAAIRAAEIGMKSADEQLRLARQAAIRDVTVAFNNVLYAREMLRLAGENLTQKQRHLEEARKRYAAGVATDYDILAADVAVENARPATIRAENTLRLTRDRLRFHLALDDEEVDARGSLDAVPTAPLPFDECLKIALASRPELKDSILKAGIYGELVTIAAAEDKPRLDMRGGAGWHKLEMDDFNSEGAAWNIGVYLSFPFFDGMRTSGRVTQARSDLATKEIEKLKLMDSIRLEVRTAVNDVQESAEILKALSGTVRQAERLLQMAEKGYELGVKIRLEVDDAQTALLQAQINRARAATDYRNARTNLEWTMGRLGE